SKTVIRLTGIPFESVKNERGRIEICFSSKQAAAVSAESSHTETYDPLHYYSWKASSGDGPFELVRIWFVN
ncbi:MAG: hypothetical protein PHI34_00610, partial [Acidobacteriota bacterium]|nr:hypothetical protein [Acidobacteriota bacterium]